MRKSKHYRKDVILARLIFGGLCVSIIVAVVLIASLFTKPSENEDTEDSQITSQESQHIDDEEEPEVDIESEDEMDTQDTYVKTTDKVKLRQEANTDCEVITVLEAGTKLLLIEELEGWYRVSYEGQEGYISADYAQVVDEEQQEPEDTASNDSYLVMIDPGHQKKGDSETEPNGPGSSEMKARVSAGATGTTTGVTEYELNLEISLMLRDELESRGYTVLMTRETHDVSISNKERAQMANEAGADITVRIHANSHTDESANGAETLAPSTGNEYVGDIAEDSQLLSKCIINAYCDATGMHNRGVKINDTMTGINWCEMPVTIVELGFMSNPTDDTNMQDDEYQKKMVDGIADGIDEYFGL